MTTAIVLAGGFGTRLRAAVPDLPKPMAPIAGKPFLEILLDYWILQGVDRFILSVGYLYEVIIRHFGPSYKGVKIVYELEDMPLGTGGALRMADRHCFDQKGFLLLNGDTFFAVDLTTLHLFASKSNADLCLSLFETNDIQRYHGVERNPDGMITSIYTKTACERVWANGGVYWCVPERLQLETHAKGVCSFENNVFPVLLSSGCRLAGLSVKAPFIDIGVPEDYYRAEQFLNNGAF